MSEQPSGQQGTTPQQPPEINDPPIEHDPIGQALVGLPFAVATGIGEAAVEGASLVGEVGKEVISWGAAELGIGAGEHLLEGGDHGSPVGGGPADGGPDAGSGAPVDAGTGDAGAPNQSLPEDAGVCEDPGYSSADMPVE